MDIVKAVIMKATVYGFKFFEMTFAFLTPVYSLNHVIRNILFVSKTVCVFVPCVPSVFSSAKN